MMLQNKVVRKVPTWAWGIKALERDEGLDVLDILKNEYVPEHPVMDLGEMIELMKEEVMLGADFTNRLPL